MKLIKLAGASLVLAIARGAALASASIPISADTASAMSDAPFAGEMAMLTSLGISPARAGQALGVQREVAETQLISRIGSALADDFAGVWFEPAAARFHIERQQTRRGTRRHAGQHASCRRVYAGALDVVRPVTRTEQVDRTPRAPDRCQSGHDRHRPAEQRRVGLARAGLAHHSNAHLAGGATAAICR